MSRRASATVDDLYAAPDNRKAEIIDGELILMAPTGGVPARAGGEIYVSLREYERQKRSGGYAFPDNVGFLVDLPTRSSLSPDAAFYVGELRGGQFLQGAPVFAAEVRSENDYGPLAERAMARKRGDYFAAGTLVVWDVDVLRDQVVRAYRSAEPEHPTVYRRGDVAEAAPAVPGWRMPVDDLFPCTMAAARPVGHRAFRIRSPAPSG